MGLNEAATAGILANFDQESEFDTKAEYEENNGNLSYGFAQWNGSRREALEDYCNQNGYDHLSAEGQAAFMEYEMKTQYPKVYEKLQNVENTPDGARQAAEIVCREYEIPKYVDDRVEERSDFAEQYYKDLSD